MDSSGNAAADFGRFMTGFLVLMGIGEFALFDPGSMICERPCQYLVTRALAHGACDAGFTS